VTLMELTGLAHKLNSDTFRAFEIFFVAGAIYLAINLTLTQIIAYLERRIAPDLAAQDAALKVQAVH
jgi:octopine/nopaline transport system permease protein